MKYTENIIVKTLVSNSNDLYPFVVILIATDLRPEA